MFAARDATAASTAANKPEQPRRPVGAGRLSPRVPLIGKLRVARPRVALPRTPDLSQIDLDQIPVEAIGLGVAAVSLLGVGALTGSTVKIVGSAVAAAAAAALWRLDHVGRPNTTRRGPDRPDAADQTS